MYRRSQRHQNNMYNVYVFGYIVLQFIVSVHLQVTFDAPPAGGATVTIAEDTAVGSGIYILQATNPAGNVPVFSILTRSPNTTTFDIDASTDSLVVQNGLDVDDPVNRIEQYTFTFSVTAGSSTAISWPLIVNITDVNDNDPVFNDTTYTAEVWKNDPPDTTIGNVSAYDPDRSNQPITYSIAGAQTTFRMSRSGVITLAEPAGLASLSSPTVLQVQASDGGRASTVAVTITIHDDPCVGRCQNGGSCTSDKDSYNCTCLSGYSGENCEAVDYCYQQPCKYGICNNLATNFSCDCFNDSLIYNCSIDIMLMEVLIKLESYTSSLESNTSSQTLTESNESNYVIADLKNFTDGTSLYKPPIEPDTITFTVSPERLNFTLNGTVLIATHGIDCEKTKSVHFNFTFRIQIENAVVICPLTLTVIGINEMCPVFTTSKYTSCLLTSMPTGTTIIHITATDADGDPITYSLSGTGSELLAINDEGLITSSSVLTATDKGMYTITVFASDGLHVTNATVDVHVYEGNCSITTKGSCQYDGCTCSSNINSTCRWLPSTTTTTITAPTRNTTSTINTGTSTTAISTSTTAASTTTGSSSTCRCSSPKSPLDDWQLLVAIGVICGCVLVILVVLIIMCCCGDDEPHTEMTNQHKIPLHEVIDEMLIHDTGIKLTIDRGGRVIVRGYDLLTWLSVHHKDQIQHHASLLLQHGYVIALDTHHRHIHEKGHYTIQLELIVDRMIHKTTGVSHKMSDNGPVFTEHLYSSFITCFIDTRGAFSPKTFNSYGKDVLEWLMARLRINRRDDAITLANYMYQQKEILSVYGEVDMVRWDSSPFMFGLHFIAGEMNKIETGRHIHFRGAFTGKDLIDWLLNKFRLPNKALALQTCKRLLYHSFIEATDEDATTFEYEKRYVFKWRQEHVSHHHGKRTSAYVHRHEHSSLADHQDRHTTSL